MNHARLRWAGPGESQSFALCPGRNRIGSDPSNEIHLAETGVSRFHALLDLADPAVLEDLGSKNGTTINGERIKKAPLANLDLLGFGSARLSFELVAAGDSEIGLEISEIMTPPRRSFFDIATRASSGEEKDDWALLRFLRAQNTALRERDEPDPAAALAAVVEFFEAAGAALLEQPREGSARLLASFGRMPAMTRPENLPGTPLPGLEEFCRLETVAEELAVARRDPAGNFLILIVRAGPASRLSSALLAACLLGFAAPPESDAAEPPIPKSIVALPPEIAQSGSAAMGEVYRQVKLLASSPIPVLILGETGVGKEHVARALHDNSGRADKPFVAINCAAIPAELLEAELFGIAQGVATGVKGRRGRFLEADRGTLLLDEIGDMPLLLQAKLLRVLQESEVTPLGERPQKIDVRVLAASHADLAGLIAEKGFREDLYYRLAGYVLNVPPLRDRLEDLPALLGHFLRLMARETGRSVRGVTVKAVELLCQERWPGNVRQLQQVVRRLVLLCPRGQAIDSRQIAEALATVPRKGSSDPSSESNGFVLGRDALDLYLDGLEKVALHEALVRTEGNRTKASALLKISRNSLARRLERLGLGLGDDTETP